MSRFAGIQAALKPNAKSSPYKEDCNELPGDQDDPEENDDQPVSKEKEKDMSEDIEKAKTEARAEGFKAANERMNAVFASEHFAGREALAQKLLAKDMSAEDIIDVLAITPASAGSSAANANAAEEAGRKEMREALEGNKNASIVAADSGQDADDEPTPQAIATGWKSAVDRANQLAGY